MDEDADDALAVLLTNGVPAAHPRPSEVPAEAPGGQEAAESATPEPVSTEAPAAETEARPSNNPWERRRDGRPSIMSRLTLAPRQQDEPDDALKLHDGVSTDTREITIVASPARPAGQQGPSSSPGLDELLGGGTPRRQQRDSPAAGQHDRDAEQPERQPAKPKRSSIPSWDDIVFGARGD